jgi:hypothetical protein
MSTKRNGSGDSSLRRRAAFVRGWSMAGERRPGKLSRMVTAGQISTLAAVELLRAIQGEPPEPGADGEPIGLLAVVTQVAAVGADHPN